jgi:hypothetical protein
LPRAPDVFIWSAFVIRISAPLGLLARTAIPAIIAVATALPAFAAPPGFAFLEIPVGGRAPAMGGAYASIANGAEAMFANAGAIAPASGIEIAAGHAEMIQKLRHDWFAISGRAWGGGLGASFRALYSEPIEERDDVGNLIGSFGAHDLEFAVGYSRPGPGDTKLGMTAQVIRERIANEAAMTYGFGFGASWEPTDSPWRAGITAQNLGPAAHYTIEGISGEGIGLPAAMQAGVSYAIPFSDRLTTRAALETRMTSGRSGIGIAGVEVTGFSGAALRAGYRFNDDASGFSAGAGYTTGRLRLDYAWVPFKLDLGDTHRFAFTAGF